MKTIAISLTVVILDDGTVCVPPSDEIKKKALLAEATTGNAEAQECSVQETDNVQERSLFPGLEKVIQKANPNPGRAFSVPANSIPENERKNFTPLRECDWLWVIFKKSRGAKYCLGRLMTKLSTQNGFTMIRRGKNHCVGYHRDAYRVLQERLSRNDRSLQFLDKFRVFTGK